MSLPSGVLNNPAARRVMSGIIEPPARGLLKIGVSPDVITVVGCVGASAAALWFLPRGQFALALIVIGAFAISDLLDGTMARMRGTSGPWGNFLDATLDRVTDGAVFAGLVMYGMRVDLPWVVSGALFAVVTGQVVPYAKARAEAVGATANVGIAERAERLMITGAGVLLAAFGLTFALPAALWLVGALGVITVVQRILHVRGQLRA
jgi:CDP-diacylglycerol--glycerol-3-phosphate 3-phosphatidyltransferase